MGIKEATSGFFEVLKKWKYLTLSIIVAILFYLINIFLSNFKYIVPTFKKGILKFLEALLMDAISYPQFFTYKSFIGLIILSLLFGFLISLITYKTKMLKNFSGETGFLTSAGIFLGMVAPGCSACGVGFLSVIGISGAAIAFLPWRGFELFLIAIILMLFSIYKISSQIDKGIVCEIPLKKVSTSHKRP